MSKKSKFLLGVASAGVAAQAGAPMVHVLAATASENALAASIEAANKLGIQVGIQDVAVPVKSQAEADAFFAAQKKQVDDAVAKYKTDKAAHDAANRTRIARLKTQEGNMNTDLVQNFKFTNGSKAIIESIKSQKGVQYLTPTTASNLSLQETAPGKINNSKQITAAALQPTNPRPGATANMWVAEGDTITVRYKLNSTDNHFGGTTIGYVEYDYQIIDADQSNDNMKNLILSALQDPTITAQVIGNRKGAGGTSGFDIAFAARFYDEKGTRLSPTADKPILVAFSSLNAFASARGGAITRMEYVKNLSGVNPIQINGSTIKWYGAERTFKADTPNNAKSVGSRFDANEWDTETSPNRWYGGAAGHVTSSTFSFTFGQRSTGGQDGGAMWFAFNSNIPAAEVVTGIVPPKVTLRGVPVLEQKGTVKVRHEWEDGTRLTTAEADGLTNGEKVLHSNVAVGTKYTAASLTEKNIGTVTKNGLKYDVVRKPIGIKAGSPAATGSVTKGETIVTYVYKKVETEQSGQRGTVKVRHEWKDGTRLTAAEADGLTNGEKVLHSNVAIGSKYTATQLAQKTIGTVTKNNLKYDVVRKPIGIKTGSPAATGSVVKGETIVTFVYDKVEQEQSGQRGTVKVEHYWEDGKRLTTDEADGLVNGTTTLHNNVAIGTKYTATPLDEDTVGTVTKNGLKYDVVRKPVGLQAGSPAATGSVAKGETIVKFVYRKEEQEQNGQRGTVRVVHEWEDGTRLTTAEADGLTNGQKVLHNNVAIGTKYATTELPRKVLSEVERNGEFFETVRVFKGLKQGSAAKTGEVKSGSQVVTLVYRKVEEKPTDRQPYANYGLVVKAETANGVPLEETVVTNFKDTSILKADFLKQAPTYDTAANAKATIVKGDVTYVLKGLKEGSAPAAGSHEMNKTTTVTYVYEVQRKITTSFVDEGGSNIIPPVEGEEDPREIPGYTFTNKTDKDPNGNTTHVYHKIQTHFRDEANPNGDNIAPSVDGAVDKIDITNYTFVRTVEGEHGDVIHLYKKNPVIVPTTSFVEVGGKVIEGPLDGKLEKKDIPNYRFVETRQEGDHTIHVYKKLQTRFVDPSGKDIATPVDGNVPKKEIPDYEFVETRDEDGNTIHVYRKLTTRFVNAADGSDIETPVDGKVDKKNIPGYVFVETKTEGGTTIHSYRKVTTSFVNVADGSEVAPKVEGTADKRTDIPNFEYVTTETTPEGDTVHKYRKLTTRFIDRDTKGDIIPAVDGKQPKQDLKDYVFVGTEENDGVTTHIYRKAITKHVGTDGKPLSGDEVGVKPPKKDIANHVHVETKVVDGDTVHVYRKVKTRFVEDGTDKDIIPSVDGNQPKRDLDYYDFVRTDKDKNGDPIHVYKRKVTKKPSLPNTGEAMSLINPVAGAGLGAIGLGALVVKPRKKKQD